ncbi:thioredoxin domain-containing protein [Paenibacillus puerhi]|uniref:hypothetical protein n=1 Tax=Paenibacillus puerhi TaxID=2692622 RepID=UPI00135BD999|nr:hypothetical protein [Paenibacillus puerhi]
MSLTDLKKLFAKENRKAKQLPYGKDELFPSDLISHFPSTENYLIGFLSLGCSFCAKLLPKLQEFVANLDHEFILVTDGEPEENEEIKKFYNFSFMVISYENFSSFRVTKTPFFYKIGNGNKVISGFQIDTIEELLKLRELSQDNLSFSK